MNSTISRGEDPTEPPPQFLTVDPIFHTPGTVPDFYIFPGLQVTSIKGKGLGVVTKLDVLRGQILECCPVLLLEPNKSLHKDWARLHSAMLRTIFTDYIFAWSAKHGAVALGYGGLYNHSSDPNVETVRFVKQRKLVVVAQQDIARGTEITFAYKTVWFQPAEEGAKP